MALTLLSAQIHQAEAAELSKDDLVAYATEVAEEHNLNVPHFLAVISCESRWDTHAKGDYVNGVPTSFGLAQLHYPQRDWGISIEQAQQPRLAMEIMAKAWERNEYRRWSCWSLLNKAGWPS